MKLSLRWKLVLGSLLVEIVMLSFLVTNSLRLNEAHLQQLAGLRLREVSVLLNASLGPSLVQQDFASVTEVFRQSRSHEGITYFLLYDRQGQLVAADGWQGDVPQKREALHLQSDDHRLDSQVDIVLAGQAYGTLFFGMSTGFLDRARADLLTESLFIAAMEVLLSLICLAALGTWLTRHLKTLERAAIAISDGQFDVRLPVAGEDELSVVARALNRMGEELASEMAALRRSEQQQREAAARLQAVFDAVPDYLSLSRVSDGRILKANGGFAQLTGYEAEYALGRTTVDLGIWANQAHRDIWISRLMSAGSLADYQTSMRTRDGRLVVVLLSATMLEIDGEPHIVALCKDITERLQVQARIEKARRDLQAVLDAASEVSIIATDPDGLITMFNRGAEKLLGYSAADVVGKQTPALFHDREEMRQRQNELRARYGSDLEGISLFTALAVEQGSETRNWTYIRCDGVKKTVSLAVTAMRDDSGAVKGFLGIGRDITPQLEAERALETLNNELEQRVTERTAALQKANHELADAMAQLRFAQDELVRSEKMTALGNMVAVVAHELNTPIGNSLTVASTMFDRSGELARAIENNQLKKSALQDYLAAARDGNDILLRSLRRASELITNFKHVAVDQTTGQRRSFDLKEVVEDMVSVLSPMLRKTTFRLQLSVPEGIQMDSFPGPLEQVVTNLITNALAHAFDQRSDGLMTLTAAVEAEDRVLLEFCDDGVGIPEEHLSRIFDPFFTTKMGRGGTGLGLNIVHSIVTKTLGGQLEVKSRAGAGTQFTLHLPLRAPAAP